MIGVRPPRCQADPTRLPVIHVDVDLHVDVDVDVVADAFLPPFRPFTELAVGAREYHDPS